MKYGRFEELPVWNASQEMAVGVFELVSRPCFSGKGDLRNQLQRSSLSVSNNVAEGFERGSTNELIAYLYIARGSAGETRSGLVFADRPAERGQFGSNESEISDLRSEITHLVAVCESVSRQLRGWADHLQNTDIKGPRHLNDTYRDEYQSVKRAEAFREKLRETVERGRRKENPNPENESQI